MRLRKERKAAKLTQYELARQSKVPQGTISKMERGDILRPSFETLNRLATVLNRCGRSVTEKQLQPRPQPLLIKGARSTPRRRGAA
jgi:transcriptional regulator with XRE-family HTH domain